MMLAPPTAPDTEPDRLWFLDHRRQHRLRREDECVVAARRDGRAFRLPWPAREPVPQHEAFAARIFEIAMRANGPAA